MSLLRRSFYLIRMRFLIIRIDMIDCYIAMCAGRIAHKLIIRLRPFHDVLNLFNRPVSVLFALATVCECLLNRLDFLYHVASTLVSFCIDALAALLILCYTRGRRRLH